MDRQERPVIYSCFTQASNRGNPESNIRHLMMTLEHAVCLLKARNPPLPCNSSQDILDHTPPTQQWFWIIDFEGFGLVDCAPNSALLAATLLSHYPERLGTLLLLDSPWLFRGLWRAVSPLLNAETKAKIQFLPLGNVEAALGESIGSEMLTWLIEEAQENRDPNNAHVKKFWDPHWRDALKSETEDKPQVKETSKNRKGKKKRRSSTKEVENHISHQLHDPRGVSSFVTSPEFKALAVVPYTTLGLANPRLQSEAKHE